MSRRQPAVFSVQIALGDSDHLCVGRLLHDGYEESLLATEETSASGKTLLMREVALSRSWPPPSQVPVGHLERDGLWLCAMAPSKQSSDSVSKVATTPHVHNQRSTSL